MNAAPDSAPVEGGSLPPPSPGALLRLARERAGLAVDDLAAQLKLARNTLEALERDDFAGLSEPVYVRGYYRKIAKTLGIPDKELLEAYAAHHPAHAVPVRAQPLPLAGGVDAGISRRAQSQGLLTAGVIVVLSVGLVMLFSEPQRTTKLPRPAPAAPVSQPAAEPAPAVAEPGAVTDAPTATQAGSGASVAAVPVSTAAPAPAPAADTTPAPASEPAAAPAAASQPPPANPTQIVLQFTESSFVRVEDSRGRTLLIGLVRGGENPVLDGQPPYTVFLGNARNVKVFRNGQAVDFSADINAQNETARFTVP